jgi:ATP-dependent DNA helicase RecG
VLYLYNKVEDIVYVSDKIAKAHPEARVTYAHGQMDKDELEDIWSGLVHGEIDVLVCTTIIETGVDLPNANTLIIENADRFGLSQLHQLRGRVGRGKRKSYCVLVSAFASGQLAETTAGKRLKSLCQLYDGYAIAEQDLLMRGPGDFFRMGSDDSIRQSGGIRLGLAEQCDDSALMSGAFSEAASLIGTDPTLENHPALLASLHKLFTPEAGTMN